MNLVISLCIFAAVLIGAFWARPNPSWWFLRDRPLDTTLWERGYSQSQIPIVICALQAIAEAFLLRKDDIYRLYPGDRLHAIYKAALSGVKPFAGTLPRSTSCTRITSITTRRSSAQVMKPVNAIELGEVMATLSGEA
jgi:hypothetical protein